MNIDRNSPTLGIADNCPYVLKCVAAFVRAGVSFAVVKPDKHVVESISPKGGVPLLFWQGRIVFESGIICDLLNELGEQLLTGSLMQRAELRSWAEYDHKINTCFFKTISAFGCADYDGCVHTLTKTLIPLEAYVANNLELINARVGLLDCAYLSFFIRVKELNRLVGINLLGKFPNLLWLSERAHAEFIGKHPYIDSFRASFNVFAAERIQQAGIELVEPL